MKPVKQARPNRQLDVLLAAAVLVGAWLLAAPAHAQAPTGTILGNVKDSTGAAVPAAQVTATHLGTQFSRSTTTDPAGQYVLRLLPVGDYKLEVTMPGFKTFSQTGILIEVGRNARIGATIETGGVEEVVSVIADAPLVETSSASLSRTVGQNEVLNLPLVNRDLYALLSLTGASAATMPRIRSAVPSSSRRSTARAARRTAASTSSSTAATTRRACAAPETRRRTRKRSRSSG